MPISTLFTSLNVARQSETWQANRVGTDWTATPLNLLGALSAARPEVQEQFGQNQADQIFEFSVNSGRYRDAKVNDRLTDDNGTHYYVRGMDDVSSGGRWCLYFLGLRPGNG